MIEGIEANPDQSHQSFLINLFYFNPINPFNLINLINPLPPHFKWFVLFNIQKVFL